MYLMSNISLPQSTLPVTLAAVNVLLLQRAVVHDFVLGNPVDLGLSPDGAFNTNMFEELLADPDQMSRHVTCLGVSGSGKTFLLLRAIIWHIRSGRGFTVIDSRGDLPKLTLLAIALLYLETGDESLLDRTDYLSISPEQSFGFSEVFDVDLSVFPEDCREVAFEMRKDALSNNWEHALTRSESDEARQVMKRLKRWLRNGADACCVPLDEHDTQLSPNDMYEILLDVYHPQHDALFGKLRATGRLNRSTVQDFEMLHGFRDKGRFQDVVAQIDSTTNNLSEFFSSAVQTLFAHPDNKSFCYEQAVRDNHFVILDLRSRHETLSETAASKVADLFITRLRGIGSKLEELGESVPHTLYLEEVGHGAIAQDLESFFELARKWQLSIWIVGQQANTLQQGSVDIIESALANSKTVFCFQQKSPESISLLAPFLWLPNANLAERVDVRDRPDPTADEIKQLTNYTRGGSRGVTNGVGKSVTNLQGQGYSISKSKSDTTAAMRARTNSAAKTISSGTAHAEGVSVGANEGASISMGPQHLVFDGEIVALPAAPTHQHGCSNSTTSSDVTSTNEADSAAIADSTGKSWSWSNVLGLSARGCPIRC